MARDAGESGGPNELIVGPYWVSFASDDEDRTDEYRLRYKVFVEEYGFESADRCPDGLERDEFDGAACSMLLRDAATGELAACQRLILPERLPQGTLTNLEHQYASLAGHPSVDFTALPRDSWAEASRTTIAKRYRWGGSAASMPAMMAIKFASIALATAFNRPRLFSLSEPPTARLIRRMGFLMVQIGAPVEFHGRRAPFSMDVDAMAQSVHDDEQVLLDNLVHGAREWRKQWLR
ncbi:MAG: GNAT family N-acyltransferase [Vicinamibacterales bacterium]